MISYYILGGMAALFPAASYLLYLSMINGRPHPTLIAGPWDFVGVLAGLSGFLFIAGPACLLVFEGRWRPALVQSDWAFLTVGTWSLLWYVPWALYLLAVGGGALFWFWRRRAYTMIYNIEPTVVDTLLLNIFSQLGLEASRVGNRIQVRAAAARPGRDLTDNPAPSPTAITVAPNATGAVQVAAPESVGALPQPLDASIDIDLFPSMRNATLHWRRARGTIREDVEGELTRQLLEVETIDNPAASWLLTISSCTYSLIFLGLVGFILLMMRR